MNCLVVEYDSRDGNNQSEQEDGWMARATLPFIGGYALQLHEVNRNQFAGRIVGTSGCRWEVIPFHRINAIAIKNRSILINQ